MTRILVSASGAWLGRSKNGSYPGFRSGHGEREAFLNIIFDLGGVVLTWRPEEIIASSFADPEVRVKVAAEIFGHADWHELDRGTLPLREAIVRAAGRTGLPPSAVADLMRQVPIALVPVPATVDLLYRLKARGHRLFYLSNMHVASIEHVESAYVFWNVFEGGVISCRVHLIKPGREIYTYLLEKYGLDSVDTIFIDDTAVNLETPARLGMQTIKFENPAQCEDQLRVLGIS